MQKTMRLSSLAAALASMILTPGLPTAAAQSTPSSGAPIPPPVSAPLPVARPAGAPISVAQHLEIGHDYPGLILRFLRDNPNVAKADRTIRWWSWYRFPSEYNPIANQEFKLQPLLERGRQDLATTMASYDADRVLIHLQTQFGTYDFANQRFPVNQVGPGAFAGPPMCCMQSDLPGGVQITMIGADAVTGFPMASQAAQAFVEKRTRFGSVDRGLGVEIQLKLDAQGIHQSNFAWVASGTVESVTFTTTTNGKTEPLYTVGPTEMVSLVSAQKVAKEAAATAEKQRQEAAAAMDRQRQEEFRRQQLVAQREQNIRMLADASLETRLWNFIQTGDIETFRGLDSVRNIRLALARQNGPNAHVQAVMAVQVSGSGHDKVSTKWPGHLDVTLADPKVQLKSDGWYLVSGAAAFEDGDEPQSVQLVADNLYACTQPKCADAADPATIVDRHIAAPTQQGMH